MRDSGRSLLAEYHLQPRQHPSIVHSPFFFASLNDVCEMREHACNGHLIDAGGEDREGRRDGIMFMHNMPNMVNGLKPLDARRWSH